ncbi:MAG: BMP family ABC transporter substrate-binding protein [Chthonomonadales bacterium]
MKSLRGLLALSVLFLIGCGEEKKAETPPPGGKPVVVSEAPKVSPIPAGTLKVAMVTDTGGIDDQSFNAGCWAGIQRAEKELGIPKSKYLESKEQNDYSGNLGSLADQGNQLVIGVGFMMKDAVTQAAKDKPGTKFAIVDESIPGVNNVIGLKFREEEGCFLAGYLAAKMSKKGVLGFVGGKESPLITKFEVGYKAGAKTARPDIRVMVKYVGDWTDAPKGQQIAEELFKEADIIFAAAGKSGLGVMDAAAKQPKGCYAIGVDSDQDHIQKGHVLTSMMKGVDAAVFNAVKSMVDGTFKPGEVVLGIKEGGVHLSPMTYTKQDVPPALLKKVDDISTAIGAGKFKVPSTEDEFLKFIIPAV